MQIPKLYKYREFIEEETPRLVSPKREMIPRWEQTLYDGILFLSPPSSFNDPYDCDLVVDNSFLNAETGRNLCYESLLQMKTLSDPEKQSIRKRKQEILSATSFREILETALHGEVSADIEEALMHIVNDPFQDLKMRLRVLCFSELKDSILMWSHYAHHHTGFCIEYDFNRGNLKKLLNRVRYSEERNFIVGTFADKGSATARAEIYNATLHKSAAWAYEEEWRLVDDLSQLTVILGDKGKCAINLANYITGVYLGAKADERYKQQICTHFKGTRVKIYQMQMQSDCYKLVPKPIQ
ncbi:MAG: DUF2971 domain-containing protein [Oscillospiraceae bacterium]|nr:DUF2971 domain-containing protein [Oscillospiraceae bacterium]